VLPARRSRALQHDLSGRDAGRLHRLDFLPAGRPLDDLGYLAWTWCIQAQGSVPVDAQAAHLRELRDAYGPIPPEALIDAMIRSQDRIVHHSERMVRDSRLPVARRLWGWEAVRWATADQRLMRANEQTLLAALHRKSHA
jgi:hypothetical protein